MTTSDLSLWLANAISILGDGKIPFDESLDPSLIVPLTRRCNGLSLSRELRDELNAGVEKASGGRYIVVDDVPCNFIDVRNPGIGGHLALVDTELDTAQRFFFGPHYRAFRIDGTPTSGALKQYGIAV